ncbi:MAG: ATP-binding protein [Eubacteriales bacterium]
MKEKDTATKILLTLYHYVSFFILMAFLVTCCMLLFLSTMTRTMGIELTEENINTAAVLTFLNVVFLSFLCTVIDAVRRKYMVDRPVKKIVRAAEKITEGDFSVRIEPLSSTNRADGLDKIVDCFNKMAEELSGVETLRSDFISNVSHEMKTPLSVIGNYAKLMEKDGLGDGERREYARAISDASRRLSDMVTNILKLNRLENQQIYPKKETFDLSEQLRICLLQYENVWESKNIEIETFIEDDVKISADSELLSLVWNNLLSNAFKFTPEGGKVSLCLDSSEHHVTVSVNDTGCGMTAEVGAHIFEKFYQGDTSHATSGNGLGLTLVKRVVDIVGGEISVESTAGVGSTFTVRIGKC